MSSSNPFAICRQLSQQALSSFDIVTTEQLAAYKSLCNEILVVFDITRRKLESVCNDNEVALHEEIPDGVSLRASAALAQLYRIPALSHGDMQFVLAMAIMACKFLATTQELTAARINEIHVDASELDDAVRAACYPERCAQLYDSFWIAIYKACVQTTPTPHTRARIVYLVVLYNYPVGPANHCEPDTRIIQNWLDRHVDGSTFAASYIHGASNWIFGGLLPLGFRETSPSDTQTDGLFLVTTSISSVARRSLSAEQHTSLSATVALSPRGADATRMTKIQRDLWYLRAFATRFEQTRTRTDASKAIHAGVHVAESLSFLDNVILVTDIVQREQHMAFQYSAIETQTPFIVQMGTQWAVRHSERFEMCTSVAHALALWHRIAGVQLPVWLGDQ